MLTAVTFSLFGFIIGLWADSFQKLQAHPADDRHAADVPRRRFYSIKMLPPVWQKITLFNPVVYLISGFRWSFYGVVRRQRRDQHRHDARLPRALPRVIWWIFKTGHRLSRDRGKPDLVSDPSRARTCGLRFRKPPL